MTPIRRLLNIVQFDLAEKLNLARLRWYHLNHQDQYLQSVIYGNPDNCTLFRLRDVLKSYIIARYYGWEPKEEDLEEIISHTSYFNIHVDDAIYEVLTMPREEITI
jgi:hypothetical protein